VRLTARLNAAFTSSMEIGVLVEREDARTGERTLCANARATFVNIGEDGRPCPVPPLLAETEELGGGGYRAPKRASFGLGNTPAQPRLATPK
ncbi:MAG: acyl-CoA thioesterase, partial [Deltaproteobacteria bacterium]|nr:acyl-CoA thioesterase [Deltaproteobacteria bacterium]